MLIPPVSERDHRQGSLDAPIVLLEFGDYECPHCKAAFPVVKTIQEQLGDQLCFAFRHFPLVEIHAHAEPAAEAAEAAGAQNLFWEMHDLLFLNTPKLALSDFVKYAGSIGANLERFLKDLQTRRFLPPVREDIASGIRSNVPGTPTFFINGVRHAGGRDLTSLLGALKVAQ
jgi:protein-disulfide isomerase